MLDRAAGPGAHHRHEGSVERCVADGVHGDGETAPRGARQRLGEVGRVEVEGAARVGRQRPARPEGPDRVGIGLVAEGSARVERAVGDDLEGPHRQQRHPRHERVSGAPAGGECRIQPVGVDAGPHPQRAQPGGIPCLPLSGRVTPLEVDDPDDATRVSGRDRLSHQGFRRLSGGELAEAREDRIPLVLGHDPLPRRQAEARERRRVEPPVVRVATHEHDRDRPAHGVEFGDRRLPRPGRGAVPVALDDRPDLADRVCRPLTDAGTHQLQHVLGTRRASRVESAAEQRPLGEMDVRVPQPGHEPAATGIEHLVARRRPNAPTDVDDPAASQTHVDDSRRSHPVDGHDPRAPDEQAALSHLTTLPHWPVGRRG